MIRFASYAAAVLALAATPLAAQYRVDTTGTGAIIARAAEGSELMDNLGYLSDVIGPRLSGTPAMKRANDWAVEKFTSYGLTAKLEPYQFGVTWERGPVWVTLLEPFRRVVTGHSWAWTVGTGGKPLAGPVVLIDGTNIDSLRGALGRVKGAWVMLQEPAIIWNPDGPPMTSADSVLLQQSQAKQLAAIQKIFSDPTGDAYRAYQQFVFDRAYLLKSAGARGIVTNANKEHALMTMSGSPNSVSPLPNLVVSHEDYALFYRLLQRGVTPRLEARIENRFGRNPVQEWNAVGEIRGTELPGQVVIVGAHYDTWDLGTGVADNGGSSMAVLEAARLVASSGVKPRRTIRFVLFSGEEQGLLGAHGYAAAHAAEADSVQAVMVMDNGLGAITGIALQGHDSLEQLWTDLLAPVAQLGAATVRKANKNGTDHLAFVPYGIPAFNFDQIYRGYAHMHHSQSDSYDKASAAELKQAAAVMAVTALELANLPELLPRGPKEPIIRPEPRKPSTGIVR